MKSDFIFTASDGEDIAVTAYGERPNNETRCIIYAHGFKGFKDWGFVPYIGEYLSEQGFYVLTFNFSHNGIGSNPTEFTEFDKFARNTLSREVRELSEMIDAVQGGVFGPVKNPKIGILGHSRGGGVTLLTTAQRHDVGAITVWSSVASFDRYDDELKNSWRLEGCLEVVNQRTGQVMRMNVSMLDDLEIHRDDLLNIERAVKKLHCPLLIVHGEEDESVPVLEGKQIHEWAGTTDCCLMPVGGTGHTFDAVHPFTGSNEKLDSVLSKTARFFDKSL
jgi:dienelactone hydrolase